MIYKTLKKVSDVCQLLDKSKYPATQTKNGVTFTNNGDGTITVNGTATSTAFFLLFKYLDSLMPKHKYLLFGSPNDTSTNAYIQCYDDTNFEWLRDTGGGAIAIFPKQVVNLSGANNIRIRIAGGYTANNLVFKPQLFDLTEMYGAGNEPTTVAEFREKFPNELYDYKPYCFVKSYKTLLKASNVCQLLDKSKYPETVEIEGINFTNNGDGSFTMTGTKSGNAQLKICVADIKKGHKYFGTTGTDIFFMWFYKDGESFYGSFRINPFYTATKTGTDIEFYIKTESSDEVDVIAYPQLFDLTEMYGAGNEPTTVEKFRQDFPNELYDYKPYSIITSYKKSFKVTNSILL